MALARQTSPGPFRNASHPSVPSAFAIHREVSRKRTYVSSHSVPNVFVVDNEQVIASSLAAILKRHGYSATFFTSPPEALAAARSKASDLLISDVEMPNSISGIDLAIQMRAQYPTCKILLFSGQPVTFDLLAEARGRGHDFDLILKPIPPTELLYEVGKIINGSVAIRALLPAGFSADA